MCKAHWYMVPRDTRMRVLRSYRPGQEHEGWAGTTVTYQDAVKAAIEAVAIQEGIKADPMGDLDVS